MEGILKMPSIFNSKKKTGSDLTKSLPVLKIGCERRIRTSTE